jgi:hypothetical protein
MKVIGEQDAAIFLARVNFVQPIFYSVFASHLATIGNKMCYPQEKKSQILRSENSEEFIFLL